MITFIISLIPLLLLLVYKMKKSFQMMQQNWYNDDRRYEKWLKKNNGKLFVTIELSFVLVYVVSFITNIHCTMYLYAFIYLVIFYEFYKKYKKEQLKKPLVYTKRVKRLYVTTFILYLLPLYFILKTFNIDSIGYYYLIISFLVYLVYVVVILSNVINKPIEKMVYEYYHNKAVKKLKNSNTTVIGVTGSYGKTSSKNVIYEILNEKYDTIKTPLNYNTPNGLIRTINENLDKFSQYFVAEMGACHVGEIKDCCKIVHPKIGIITSIGQAHLETFKSQKNIQKTKFELIESLPKDGLGILNFDDELQRTYEIKNKCQIITIGIDNHDVDLYADNIKLTSKGTTFDCVFKNDKNKYTFETSLLGKANVYNLLTGILLGKYLGIEMSKLQMGVRKIKPVEHRLELKKYGKVTIIDDAYNSNPIGSKMALEVLGLMDGYKVVVTPGMIELGKEQYNANYNFGTYISSNADLVILVGEEQTKPIYRGLIDSKFNKDKIHVINDVRLAFPMINCINEESVYVLLENDLPDIFNE